MKYRWTWLLGCWIASATCAGAQTGLPAQPSPLSVQLGISGRPPSFLYASVPANSDQIQIEVLLQTATGDKPAARVFVDASTCYLNPVIINGKSRTEVFLRGTGLTGFMMFYQTGTYKVHWRGYNEDAGFGPWSDFSSFTRSFSSRTLTRITRAPSTVAADTDLSFTWTNDFADEVYSLQIISGRRAVRNEYGRGAFRAGWMYEGPCTYQDRPATPDDELPNGPYTFQIRAWCPIKRIWSAWAQKSFTVARSTPRLPSIMVTQQDFAGFFNRSPRPQFIARYGTGRVPALWTLFDIRRIENGRQRPVLQQWVSRYDLAQNGAGKGANPSDIYLRAEKIFADLPPGTYVWRVKAHGGHSQWWDGSRRTNFARWTDFRTNRLYAAGTLAQPRTNDMSLRNGTTWYDGHWYAADPAKPEYLSWSNGYWRMEGKMVWATVPNAFAYHVQIFRDNQWYKSYYDLDPRIHNCTLSRSGRSILFARERFPAGTYKFRVQAINRANPPNQQLSPWSADSPDFVIR